MVSQVSLVVGGSLDDARSFPVANIFIYMYVYVYVYVYVYICMYIFMLLVPRRWIISGKSCFFIC